MGCLRGHPKQVQVLLEWPAYESPAGQVLMEES